MEEAIKYKNVIREYFLEYKNRDQVLKSIFYVILFGASFLPFVFGRSEAVSGSRIEKAARGIYLENVKG